MLTTQLLRSLHQVATKTSRFVELRLIKLVEASGQLPHVELEVSSSADPTKLPVQSVIPTTLKDVPPIRGILGSAHQISTSDAQLELPKWLLKIGNYRSFGNHECPEFYLVIRSHGNIPL
ncbi:hypothetical protein NPIL_37471 [Nephila pilipes]|uniref:Uncharacterized protein n=1 Tax=Nephila pilipes TaxID=299642 RepID=A0A8X6UB38_NEPPI|nr:hypothetical protein NPIL_37471 [Nephila pilipes]